MTTATTDMPATSTCPSWCGGIHSSSANGDPGVEYHEGTIGQTATTA